LTHDSDFDDELKRVLADPPLPEGDFTRRLLDRLERHRRRRRRAFAGAGGFAALITAFDASLSSGPWIVWPPLSAPTAMAALLLAAACCLAWIGSEPAPRLEASVRG
jgi:hypothetical protein